MTQVIPNGGSRSSQDLYTGAPNEITVDQSNKELRLHDGSTAGGERIPNLDTIDARYQKKNPELDGFVFDPNQKGILTRVAAGVYRLRQLLTDGNITVTNPLGTAGDILLGLSTTLTGDREFVGGDVIIDQVLQVNGGINGNTSGSHEGSTVGDVDVRGHTLQLDDGQIPQSAVNGLAAALAALGNLALPVGIISLWSGSLETVPTHWHLCDGTNGTPDLRERFVRGAGTDAEINVTGGGTSHTHVVTSESAGAHLHNINVDAFKLLAMHMPSHTHYNGVVDNNNPSNLFNHGTVPANPTTAAGMADTTGTTGIVEGVTTAAGGDQAHAHTAESDSQGNHTHVIDVAVADHTPPFYSLAYIMKIS